MYFCLPANAFGTLPPESKINRQALEDALTGRGLEYFEKIVGPSAEPKFAYELGKIFDYRLYLISELLNAHKGKTIGPKEIFNLQAHMHALRQIATAFQVAL